MNDGFTKLFSSILTSSIWSEDNNTRILWITILALTDQDGYCAASVPGLANMARLSVDDTVQALSKLEAPDQYSRTTSNEGRRLQKVDGGWLVLNHGLYRDRERAEKRREYMRELMAKKRMLAANEANKVITHANPSASASVSESLKKGVQGETGGKGHPTPKPPKERKSAYGELQCVKLTDAEYKKLLAKHGPDKLNRGIEILDGYIAAKGAKYASHYAVMKDDGWVWKRLAEIAPGAGSTIPGYIPISNEEADRLVRGEQLNKAYEATE